MEATVVGGRTMQHPLLGVVEGDGEAEPQRAERAWRFVVEGYERALRELCADDADYGHLVRCLQHARQLAGLPPVALARSLRLDLAGGE